MKNPIDSARAYFRSSKEELFAVTWPSREDIIRYTALVIVTVIAFGIFFSAIDFVVNAAIQGIIAQRTASPAAADSSTPVTNTSTVPVEVNPVNVEATTPEGTPTNIEVEQAPQN